MKADQNQEFSVQDHSEPTPATGVERVAQAGAAAVLHQAANELTNAANQTTPMGRQKRWTAFAALGLALFIAVRARRLPR